jgi:hypothetical protein
MVLSYLLGQPPATACRRLNVKDGQYHPVINFHLANTSLPGLINCANNAVTRRTTGCGGKGINDL